MLGTASITIDGKIIPFDPTTNASIATLATQAGLFIPTLCNCPEIGVKGNCRICVVEDMKTKKMLTACSTPASDKMVIETCNAKVISMRRTIVELLLADHNRNCANCTQSKHCSLQTIADSLDILQEDFQEVFSPCKPNVIPNVLSIYRNRCVHCGRCKTYCSDILGVGAISIDGRGWRETYRITEEHDGKPLCTQCGRCAELCPVGCLVPQHHTDRVWDALDNPSYKPVFAVLSNPVDPWNLLETETGLKKSQFAIFLQRIGIQTIFEHKISSPLSNLKEQEELVQALCKQAEKMAETTRYRLILFVNDISYKRFVCDNDGYGLYAVLRPADFSLLVQQSLLSLKK